MCACACMYARACMCALDHNIKSASAKKSLIIDQDLLHILHMRASVFACVCVCVHLYAYMCACLCLYISDPFMYM